MRQRTDVEENVDDYLREVVYPTRTATPRLSWLGSEIDCGADSAQLMINQKIMWAHQVEMGLQLRAMARALRALGENSTPFAYENYKSGFVTHLQRAWRDWATGHFEKEVDQREDATALKFSVRQAVVVCTRAHDEQSLYTLVHSAVTVP